MSDEAATDGPFAQIETPSDNETIQHEDPDSANEDGDTDSVRGWLENNLDSRLSESAIQIDQGEYEQGRELLGDSYDDTLGKYVEVAGETDGGGDDETSEQFQQAKENQRELASDTEEYRETVREYREARQNGNETRARRLARDANRLATSINQTITGLNRTYGTVSNQTGVDVTDTVQVLEDIERNVTTQQADINEDLFEETNLTVSVRESSVSFVNPARVTGQITLENGTALAQRTVTLQIGGRTVLAQTDTEGRFSARYRPTVVPLGPQNLTVTYLPTNDSVYLASSATIAVDISQTDPDISLDDPPQTVSFGGSVSIAGAVAANGTGGQNVPVSITLDGVRLDTVQTARDGTFTTTVRVPAEVRSGSRTLRARVPLEGRALAPANVTRQVTVEPTATSLTLAGETQDDDSVRVSGRLTTQGGTPVANQQITLAVGDERLGIVQTGASGQFNETVSIPQAIRSNTEADTATLVASYATTETNLESAQATTAIRIVPLQTGGDSGNNGLSGLWAILANPISWAVGLVALAIAGVALVRARRDSDTDDGQSSGDEPTVVEGGQDEPAPAPGTTEQLLSTARDRLEAGNLDTAVETAYAAVRSQSSAVIDIPPGQTHWEWYAAWNTADLNSETLDALRELTELYEQAAFAPDSIDDERARRALAHANEFLSAGMTGGD
ncbi:DUF4129 domain-containing protein [Salinibaculum salinum]|uniref:DUF4129 domain-containing protein n=1 Tax=Salinibaculum salinum TaxID=3131996 RepID=UPI0030ECD657